MQTRPYVNPLAKREPDLPRGAVSEGALAHPRAEEALTFDECEEAGVDGSGRFLDMHEAAARAICMGVDF